MLVQAKIIENFKGPHHWSFVRGIHRRPVVPYTKGHWCGKHVHIMTSSCTLWNIMLHRTVLKRDLPVGIMTQTGHLIVADCIYFIVKDPSGLDSDRWIPLRGWRENPARALARSGFSQHLECGIHRSESSPEGSFALIPHPVARWAKTTP